MQKKIVIIGAGFAGLWSALAAARLRDAASVSPEQLDIVVVAPEPVLTVRPRLYEDNPIAMVASLEKLFDEVEVRFVYGLVEGIDIKQAALTVKDASGDLAHIAYDRLVLAAGSRVVRPNIPGLADHAFSVDNRGEADVLWQHVHALASRKRSIERDTVVIAGGGFTGIETAAEMPHRLREILGDDADIRVIVVERADAIGPDLGPGPRPVIEEAFTSLGVELVLGTAVTGLDANGVTLADGTRIPSATVVWTGGLRASPLTEQIDAPRDHLGRLLVDRYLRVPNNPHVFATGDAACAATDDAGNKTVMSCQHAIALGRSAGHNAAADLLGRSGVPYSQERYVTCLDLGPWGAVLTEGWDRKIVSVGAEAKALKTQINSQFIYPPQAERSVALAAA